MPSDLGTQFSINLWILCNPGPGSANAKCGRFCHDISLKLHPTCLLVSRHWSAVAFAVQPDSLAVFLVGLACVIVGECLSI